MASGNPDQRRAALRVTLGQDVHPIAAHINELSHGGMPRFRPTDSDKGDYASRREQHRQSVNGIADKPDARIAPPTRRAHDQPAE